jgi:hypothetical protein
MADEEEQRSDGTSSSSSGSGTVIDDTALPPSNGYLKLSHFMGEQPQYAIFRRFGGMAAWNLLLLPSELIWLESELHAQIDMDKASVDSITRRFDRDFWMMCGHIPSVQRPPGKVYAHALWITEVLKEYSASIFPYGSLTDTSER